jgi:hypothetical protein
MDKYEVTMFVKGSHDARTDPEITKVVEADNELEALVHARRSLRTQNPEFDYKTVWAWSISRIIQSGPD